MDRPQPQRPPSVPSVTLLERYIARQGTPEEIAAVERWLAADPRGSDLLLAIRRELAAEPQFDVEKMLGRIEARIDGAEQRTRHSARRIAASTWRSSSLVIGLAATLLVAIGIATFRSRNHVQTPVAEAPAREIVTRHGEKATLNLADGSQVVLAPESKLRIPASFDRPGDDGIRRRALQLEGKAHFTVIHDRTRPFIVHTASAAVEDIGTEFVVDAYRASAQTQVAVSKGVIALHKPVTDSERRPPVMTLVAGDAARIDTSGAATMIAHPRLANYLAWMNGVVAFDRAPLRDALRELERWYQVDFRIADRSGELGDMQITGEFRGESVDVVARQLELMLDVRVTRSGRTITIAPIAHR